MIWADLDFRKRKLANKLIKMIRLIKSLQSYIIKIDYEKFQYYKY